MVNSHLKGELPVFNTILAFMCASCSHHWCRGCSDNRAQTLISCEFVNFQLDLKCLIKASTTGCVAFSSHPVYLVLMNKMCLNQPIAVFVAQVTAIHSMS